MTGEQRGAGAYSRGRSSEGLGVAKKQIDAEMSDAREKRVNLMKGILKDLAGQHQEKDMSMEEFKILMRQMKSVINEYTNTRGRVLMGQRMRSEDAYDFTVEDKKVKVLLTTGGGVDSYTLGGYSDDGAEFGDRLIKVFNELQTA